MSLGKWPQAIRSQWKGSCCLESRPSSCFLLGVQSSSSDCNLKEKDCVMGWDTAVTATIEIGSGMHLTASHPIWTFIMHWIGMETLHGSPAVSPEASSSPGCSSCVLKIKKPAVLPAYGFVKSCLSLVFGVLTLLGRGEKITLELHPVIAVVIFLLLFLRCLRFLKETKCNECSMEMVSAVMCIPCCW